MGYTTDFYGHFKLDKSLAPKHAMYLYKFNNTRRMKRDAKKAEQLPDRIREAAGLPIGEDGAYFVGAGGFQGQGTDESIIDYNTPPGQLSYRETKDLDFNIAWDIRQRRIKEGNCQPGLWCHWTPGDSDGNPLAEDRCAIPAEAYTLVWDEGEKFYEYVAWLEYLIKHFIEPWGYVLNGEMEWQGEERDDRGLIRVTDNEVETLTANITYR